MKEFILKVNSQEISKVVSCSVSLMLTLTWVIDILTVEQGDEFEKHPLHYASRGGNFMQSLPF